MRVCKRGRKSVWVIERKRESERRKNRHTNVLIRHNHPVMCGLGLDVVERLGVSSSSIFAQTRAEMKNHSAEGKS